MQRPILPGLVLLALTAVAVGAAPGSDCTSRTWQSYVDCQLLKTKMVTDALICGHDGNIWAKSNDFEVSTAFTEGIKCIKIIMLHVFKFLNFFSASLGYVR